MPKRSLVRRLKTKHTYHDAEIRTVQFESEDCVGFEIQLCGYSDNPGAIVHLWFHRVRNMSEIRSFIDATSAPATKPFAQIISIVRDTDRRFCLELDKGSLYIDAKSFTETA